PISASPAFSRSKCSSSRNGTPLYVRNVSKTPSPYKYPWSKGEIRAFSFSIKFPFKYIYMSVPSHPVYFNKVLQQLLSRFRHNRLRLELHTFHLITVMSDSHNFIFRIPSGNTQSFREVFPANNQ